MGATRTLTRKINPAILQIAKVAAIKRHEKYLHAHARRRFRAKLQGESKAVVK